MASLEQTCWRQWQSSSKGLSLAVLGLVERWSGGLCGESRPFVTTEFTSGHGVGLPLPRATEDTLLFLCSLNKAGHPCPCYTQSHWAIVLLTNSQPKFHYIWIFLCRPFRPPSRVCSDKSFRVSYPPLPPVIMQDLCFWACQRKRWNCKEHITHKTNIILVRMVKFSINLHWKPFRYIKMANLSSFEKQKQLKKSLIQC